MTHSRDNKPVAVEQGPQIEMLRTLTDQEVEKHGRMYSSMVRAGLLQDILSELAQHRLRLAGQDRGEGFREALENIANGRQPSASGSPLACTQLDEIRLYARAALSTQPPPVSDVRESVARFYYEKHPIVCARQLGGSVAQTWGTVLAYAAHLPEYTFARDTAYAFADDILALIASQALAHASVGEGYAVVPVEPTEEMIEAGGNAAGDHRWKLDYLWEYLRYYVANAPRRLRLPSWAMAFTLIWVVYD